MRSKTLLGIRGNCRVGYKFSTVNPSLLRKLEFKDKNARGNVKMRFTSAPIADLSMKMHHIKKYIIIK